MKFRIFKTKNTITKSLTRNSNGGFNMLPKEKQQEILKKSAKDFAVRFEGVMKELSNG